VLIEVDDCWFVLSERALLTYAFGSRLTAGEPLRFVRSTKAGLERWLAQPAAGISFAEVEARFGPAVARRARRDAAAVLVRMHREV
jgi:hypothetical protein